VSLALTGPEARYGLPMLRGVELAVEEANRAARPGGAMLETLALDSASPGQGAISRQLGLGNYQRFVADEAVVAVVGPQTSGEARAAAPLLGRAGLVTITPSATTFDFTDLYGPQAGRLLVAANVYTGYIGRERFRRLRENFTPVGHVGYAYLLFDVSPEALRRVTDPIPPDYADKIN